MRNILCGRVQYHKFLLGIIARLGRGARGIERVTKVLDLFQLRRIHGTGAQSIRSTSACPKPLGQAPCQVLTRGNLAAKERELPTFRRAVFTLAFSCRLRGVANSPSPQLVCFFGKNGPVLLHLPTRGGEEKNGRLNGAMIL